ncbi:MAG: phage tail protein [Croceimicrobium sp.]
MALDSRFVLADDLQVLFRDKDTGLPLRNGVIRFFEDKARNVEKLVYTLSGSPPNYTYVALGTTITLNSAGYVDPQFYYFPFDGTPTTTTDLIDLYFITIEDENGQIQDTREAWPNTISTTDNEDATQNFIANGQLLLHTDIPALAPFAAGIISKELTDLAYGGFQYKGPSGPTGEISVTFSRFGSYVSVPEESPRYAVRIQKTGTTTESIAQWRIIFGDVNKFASDTQEFTFKFTGLSPILTEIESINIIKNFGTGGTPSPEQTIPIQTNIPLTANYTQIVVGGFTFGNNSADTLGTNDDDFVALGINFPTTIQFDASMTNFVLLEGNFTAVDFPIETDREFIEGGLGGGFPVPATDGSDLFLPAILTRAGWIFDKGVVGEIVAAGFENPPQGYLLCDGARYDTTLTSPDGIPYSRLFDVIGNNWGPGNDFVTEAQVDMSTAVLALANLQAGAVTAPANGAPSPGFIFSVVHTGTAPGYFVDAWLSPLGLTVFNDNPTNVDITNNGLAPLRPTDGVGPGATGFTFTVNKEFDNYFRSVRGGALDVIPDARAAFEISNLPVNTVGLEGTYFEFDSMDPVARIQFYMWFQVNNVGVDPAIPGRTGILVNLSSNDNQSTLAFKIRNAFKGSHVTWIDGTAGSPVPQSSYWTFETPTETFYVWYNIASGGTDPAIPGRTGLEVPITGTTPLEALNETFTVLATRFFGVPDLRGKFIRGFDPGSVLDPDTVDRFKPWDGVNGNGIGSDQLYSLQAHNHTLGEFAPQAGATTDCLTSFGDAESSGFTGTQETRPYNVAVQHFIRY